MTPDPVVRSLSSQLRNLARLAAQWADVLESTERRESGFVGGSETQRTDYPAGSSPAAAANSSAEPVPDRRDSGGSAALDGRGADGSRAVQLPAAANPPSAPVFFRCPQCNRMKEWRRVDKKPWPNAVCSECYAFNEERNDQRIAEVEGYTGVR